MFAFKLDADDSSRVFGIPFDSIDPRDVRVVAENFRGVRRGDGLSFAKRRIRTIRWTGVPRSRKVSQLDWCCEG